MAHRSLLGAANLFGFVCAAGLAPGCIGDSDPDTAQVATPPEEKPEGEVGLELRLPDGSQATRVDYIVAHAGITERAGSLPANDSGRIRMQLANLPPGSDYTLLLRAERDNGPACQGSAPFMVTPGETTRVSLAVQCGLLGRGGNLAIDGSFNYCPSLPTLVATPSTASIGETVLLHAEASDEDAVTFRWSALSGTFATPERADTTFVCNGGGDVRITVAASDSRGCMGVTSTTTVTCGAEGRSARASATPSSVSGPVSSLPAYILPIASGVKVKSIFSSGDSANSKPALAQPYRMVGAPAGISLLDEDENNFTLLAQHILGNTSGSARSHGATGAFISRWQVRKSDLAVLHGEDLIRVVLLWDDASGSQLAGPAVRLARLAAADLPERSGLFDDATGAGCAERLLLSGESSGAEGRVFAHQLDGLSYELPRFGRGRWGNIAINPKPQTKTVTLALEASASGGPNVYVGSKSKQGLAIERAGLGDGVLYRVAAEPSMGAVPVRFSLVAAGDVQPANAAPFPRAADGAWDPQEPRDFYFVTADAREAGSRLYRLRFDNLAQPELGGILEMLLDGSEGQVMLGALAIDARGHLLLAERPGNSPHVAQLFRYTVASDQLVAIAQHNPARFTPGASGLITQDEEVGDLVDATRVLGAGWWLVSDQIHTPADDELVEGGQFDALYDPGTL